MLNEVIRRLRNQNLQDLAFVSTLIALTFGAFAGLVA